MFPFAKRAFENKLLVLTLLAETWQRDPVACFHSAEVKMAPLRISPSTRPRGFDNE